MEMTKELEKRLELMRRFNQKLAKYSGDRVYYDRIFVHNDLMYATDGHIFVVAKNLTEEKDFSFFGTKGKKFKFFDFRTDEAKYTCTITKEGHIFEKILSKKEWSLSFDIDFEGYPLPTKLQSTWSNRIQDKMKVNFQTEEVIIDFCGGSDVDGGVTGEYGDILKNVSGNVPEHAVKIMLWNIMEIMKQTKVKKLHIESDTEKNLYTCTVGDYTFIFTGCVE